MPTVNLPDGTTLNFPDGMSDADMASAINSNFPQFAAPAAADPNPGVLTRISQAIKDIPIVGPNDVDMGVMGRVKPGTVPTGSAPAGMGPMYDKAMDRAMQQEMADPLDPRLAAIKPADAQARLQNEASRRHAAQDDQWARVLEDGAREQSRTAAAQRAKVDSFSPDALVGNTTKNVRNVSASLLKIGPTAAKGVADIGRLLSGDRVGKDASEYFENGMQEIDRLIADPTRKGQNAAFSQMMADPNSDVGDMFAFLVDNPDVLIDNGITTIGSMLLPAGMAKGAVLGARAAGLGAGAASTAATATTLGTVAAQNAADTFTTDSLANSSMPDRYKAASVSAAVSLLFGIATRGGAEGEIARRMAGELSTGRTTLEAAKGYLVAVGKEATQEAGEEFGNAAGEAVALNENPLNKATAKRMAFAATLGGLMGGAAHVGAAGQAAPDDGSAGADAARAAALAKWSTSGLSPSNTRIEGAPAAPAADARIEPSMSDIAGAPAVPARPEPTIADIGAASSIDEAIAAAQAVVAAPVSSAYATAADIDALEQAAGMDVDLPAVPAAAGMLEAMTGKNPGTEPAQDLPAWAQAAPALDVAGKEPGALAAAAMPAMPQEGPESAAGADWFPFPQQTGTLGVPRAQMPQIKAEHRGAMVNFLNARGITHEQVEIPSDQLKPTQAEFSMNKVDQAIDYQGGDRSILVSSDGHVLDGHHQWMAALEADRPVKAIRLNAPIAQLLDTVREFPSAGTSEGPAPAPQSGPQTIPENIPAPAAQATPGQEKAAALELRNQRQEEAVNQAAAALEQRKKTGGQGARDRMDQANPFLGFLAKNGLQLDERSDTGGQGGRAGNVMVSGYGPLYRRSGKRLDELAQLAVEAGFLTQQDLDDDTDTGGTRKLADMIERAAHRKEVIARPSTPDAAVPSADQQLLQEAQSLGIDTDGKTPDQLYDEVVAAHADKFSAEEARMVLDADIPLDGGTPSTNLTDEEIDAIFGIQTSSPQAAGQETESDPASAAPAGPERTEEAGDGGELLTPYSRGEVLERQDAEETAAKARQSERDRIEAQRRREQDKKDVDARMDASADNFQLGQSAEDAIAGQASIFDAPAPAPAAAAAAPAHQYNADEARPLLLIACSDAKKDGTHNALDLYQGVMFDVLRKWMPATEGARPDVYVISAKHGLIHATKPTENYNQRMTPERQQELVDQGVDLAEFAGKNFSKVFIAGGQDYQPVAIAYVQQLQKAGHIAPGILPTATRGSIGIQRSQLGEYLRGLESSESKIGKSAPESGKSASKPGKTASKAPEVREPMPTGPRTTTQLLVDQATTEPAPAIEGELEDLGATFDSILAEELSAKPEQDVGDIFDAILAEEIAAMKPETAEPAPAPLTGLAAEKAKLASTRKTAAADAPAKPKRITKQQAAEQRVREVLGASVGDTITMRFKGKLSYFTSGDPMLIDRITARGDIYFKDQKNGSGTSERLTMIEAFAANPANNLTWEVTPAPEAEPAAKAKPAARKDKASDPLAFIRKYAKTPGAVPNDQVRKVLLDAGPMAAEVAAILGEEPHLLTAVGNAMDEFGYKFTGFDGLRPMFNKPVSQAEQDAAAAKREERGAGEAALSAAKNTGGAFINAIDGLGALFGGNSTFGSGPVFNDETYAKAKPLFLAAAKDAGAALKDVQDVVRAIVKSVLAKFGPETTANMRPYVIKFMDDVKAGTITLEGEDNADVGTGTSAERDPGIRTDATPATEQDIFDVRPAAGGRARRADAEPDAAGDGQVDRAGVPGRDAADAGTESDRDLPVGQQPRGTAPGAAESRDAGRSGDRGNEESKSQSEAVGEPATRLGARLTLDEKRQQQLAAESVPVVTGDRENIDATLPYLLEGQRDDVHFAETRFANPDKQPGVMLTNGTGTGKTFSGLGIAKRFERMGKGNGLIVVPNGQIAQDWIDSGAALGLEIRTLDSMTENGDSGMTITTYANFGGNKTLADRDWDFVMPDESHYLMAAQDGKTTDALTTLRALTRHPAGFAGYSRMVNRDLYDQLAALGPNQKAKTDKLWSQLQRREEQQREEYAAIASAPIARPKTVFLSATPFAYVKAVDYAEGFLFQYPEDGRIGNSNQDGRAHFFVRHFGYRIRYHKLTAPDANVDQGLMARQFNSWLKSEGALSGRMLDVEADYDRKFVMVQSALGTKIDEGLEFMREHKDYKHLYGPMMKQFDYLSRRYLLEAIKAKESLPLIQQQLDLGRKVIIVHDYKKGGAFNPFHMPGMNGTTGYWDGANYKDIDLAKLATEFKAERPDLVNLKIPAQSALQIFKAAFPDALVHNGDVPARQLEANKRQFNDDNGEHRIIILQSDKGREGISLHDTTGKFMRVQVNVGMQGKPTAIIQLEGRSYRNGQVTDAAMRYISTGTMWERYTFAQTIAERADTAEALAMGELARGLKESIIEAYEAAGEYPAGDTDGKGGKERDRQASKLLTDWDRAKSFYYAQLKRSSGQAREGLDYYATPEPVGMKMVEWADIRPGEAVLEPSAGHGAIARWFPVQSAKTIVEPETDLIMKTRMAVDGQAKFVQSQFEDLHLVNKYDAIVMNPPFGKGGSLAIPHLAKAYRHLNEGGRIVALLPRGGMTTGRLDKFLNGDDAPKDLHLVAEIDLPNSTFSRAGTGVLTRIVVLDKLADASKAPNMVRREYVNAESVEELFQRIEGATIPGRAKIENGDDIAIEEAKPAPAIAGPTRAAAPGATGAERFYAQFEFDHTKTGAKVYGAAMLNRTSKDVYQEANAIAKANGGWYSSFAGGGAKRGFLFKTSAGRATFMEKAAELDEVTAGLDEQNSLAADVGHNPRRRQLLAAAAAATIARRVKNGAELGKATPIAAEVLDAPVTRRIAAMLRDGRESGQPGDNGLVLVRKAVLEMSYTGPKELRALASQVALLLPTEGSMQLTVDDTSQVNANGTVSLVPLHMRLFTAGGRTGLSYGTVLHEAMHVALAARYRSLSAGMVRGNDAILGLSAPAAAKALEQFDGVWNEFRQMTGEEQVHNPDLALAIAEARGNPDEFFVRALTDANLQAYMATKRYEGKTLWTRFKDWIKTNLLGLEDGGTAPSWLDAALTASTDVLEAMGGDRADFARMRAIDAAGMRGTDAGVDVMASRRTPPVATWTVPDMTTQDTIVQTLQDKHIDMRRVVDTIREQSGQLEDKWNPYLQEELFHGRSATGFKSFLNDELTPLLEDMKTRGVDMATLEQYLHMRHAEEANKHLAGINKDSPDGLAGVSTQEAKDYLKNLTPTQMVDYQALAAKVDAIIEGTQRQLVEYGLEKQSTIDTWNATYKNYVPLFREGMEDPLGGTGTGGGFDTRGSASRRRTGSDRAVVDILANVAMARERAIVRGEKNRLDLALYGLALQAPNPSFWKPVNPQKNPGLMMGELIKMGLTPAEAQNIVDEPKQPSIDLQTGRVVHRANPLLRKAPNVVAVRINGEDRFIFFNKQDPRALRMAMTIKNLGNDQLGRALGSIAVVTRAFAAINTQYNPVFGMVNLMRDLGEGSINLSATPLAGRQAEFVAETGRLFVVAARRGFRLEEMTGADAALWKEFQEEGGITGYRQMFGESADRAQELMKQLNPDAWMESRWGKVFTADGRIKVPYSMARRVGTPVFDWLSDYNEALENVTRMSAYKLARADGMTAQQAASLAKNLTVNFNRKGAVGSQVGALYAFYNAAAQGTARMARTLASPAGKKIVLGGLLLGVLQAVMMLAAGYDDEEPPEFIKSRNLVIPLGWITGKKNYFSVPMPLGFSIIPTMGRLSTEFALRGMKKPGKYLGKMFHALLETFNPIGGGGNVAQILSPTAADPITDLWGNRDWTGKPIAREDLNGLHPTPGYTRTKATASAVAKGTSYYLNLWSGGTKYTPGAISPTPDQIDYLIGQFTGGVGREASKLQQSVASVVTGEDLPAYKVPLGGRLYGNNEDGSNVSDKFYANLKELNTMQDEVKGRAKDRANPREFIEAHPEARLAERGDATQRQVSQLRKRKTAAIEKGDRDEVKKIETRMRTIMDNFNQAVDKARQKASK